MGYILGPFMYGDEDEDKQEVLSMSEKDAVIRALEDIARRNRGQTTGAEQQRADAVAVLAGKQPSQKPLRPGVKELLGR